jgi:hypothetical protein
MRNAAGIVLSMALVLGSATGQTRPDSVLKPVGSGSGFLVASQGYVITNSHVVQGCASVAIQVKGVSRSASILVLDRENDLALLQTDIPAEYHLTFRSNQRIRLGEAVIVVGFPLHGITASSINLTTGTISALAGLGDDTRMIQFTAPVQPGNSGGPLLDQSGNVIGVVTSKLSAAWAAKATGDIPQNVNFAIRDSVVKAFLDSRGVEYELGIPSASGLQTTEVAERTERGVVLVQCLGSGDPSTATRSPRSRRTSDNVLRVTLGSCREGKSRPKDGNQQGATEMGETCIGLAPRRRGPSPVCCADRSTGHGKRSRKSSRRNPQRLGGYGVLVHDERRQHVHEWI